MNVVLFHPSAIYRGVKAELGLYPSVNGHLPLFLAGSGAVVLRGLEARPIIFLSPVRYGATVICFGSHFPDISCILTDLPGGMWTATQQVSRRDIRRQVVPR